MNPNSTAQNFKDRVNELAEELKSIVQNKALPIADRFKLLTDHRVRGIVDYKNWIMNFDDFKSLVQMRDDINNIDDDALYEDLDDKADQLWSFIDEWRICLHIRYFSDIVDKMESLKLDQWIPAFQEECCDLFLYGFKINW
jgi:hypothetical protein